ncbi:MAG: DoxX family membrane protein, partial [Plesiomonas shigelloides]
MRFIDLLARALMAQIFIIAGWGKLGAGYAGTEAYMQSVGLPG